MTESAIKELLDLYKNDKVSASDVVAALKQEPFEKLDFALVDHGRELRQGFPEVVYAAGKTKEQILAIMQSLLAHNEGSVMATRADEEKFAFVKAAIPEARYDHMARMIYVERSVPPKDAKHYILVVTAGTSDVPVAEEARLTAHLCGSKVKTCYDCGVAGIHRLLSNLELIRGAAVIIVIAGMEGALASVVGGLTDKPVIAVPTSVGYGASFNGLAALLSMLNSCASGVSVVNIDNGFGAGIIAAKINRMVTS